jgi:hypothetical protein
MLNTVDAISALQKRLVGDGWNLERLIRDGRHFEFLVRKTDEMEQRRDRRSTGMVPA